MATKMLSLGLTVDQAAVPATVTALTVIPKHASRTLQVGVAVSNTPIAEIEGGTPPYKVVASVGSGSLPAGVVITSSANSIYLTGTPTMAGTSSVQILLDVSDSEAKTASATPAKKGTWG